MSKIRIAFVGTGGIAGKHSGKLKDHPDVDIVGGADVSTDVVRAFFERTTPGYKTREGREPAAFADIEAMYAALKPDAVVICTPHTLHFEHAMQALGHGAHVLMEKPMVTQADHAYILKDRVEEAGKVFVIGYNTPCSPEFKFIRESIRTQRYGKLQLVSGFLSQNWRRATLGTWRQNPALSGGGQAYDSGAHLLNSLCWSVESNVAEVFAFIDNMDTPVDINSAINIRFENGVFAAIVISGDCPANGGPLSFIFDNGRIDVDGWSATTLEIYDGRQKVRYPPITGTPLHPADNFIDAILGRDEPRTTPQNGIVHSELMDAIYESARTNRPARPKSRDLSRA